MSLRASRADVLLEVTEPMAPLASGTARPSRGVDVHPGAKSDRFPDAYDPWRKRVKASVKEPALRGAPNRALVRLVAQFFHLGSGDVAVEQGATDFRKTLRLRGITLERAEAMLRGVMGAAA